MSAETNSEETNLDCEPIELSAQELETISGGIDVCFTGFALEQSEELSMQQIQTDTGLKTSFSMSTHLSLSIVQFVGTGFESVNDAMKFIGGLTKLFGK
jgi:hypothetical protein